MPPTVPITPRIGTPINVRPTNDGNTMAFVFRNLVYEICATLSPKDLHNLCLACTQLRAPVVNDHKLWSASFKHEWPAIHKALLIPPVKWNFLSAESRAFAFLLSHEKRRQKSSLRILVQPLLGIGASRNEDPEENTEIDVIVQKMKTHSKSLLFQKAACYAIRRLCYYPADATPAIVKNVEANVQTFGECKIVKLILNGLKYFIKDQDFLAGAFCALGNLCSEENQNSLIVLHKGGIERVLKALRVHHDCNEVVDYGCFLMKNLALVNPENKRIIAEKGALAALQEVLGKNLENANVITWCLDLIAVLTRGVFYRERKRFRSINTFLISKTSTILKRHRQKPEVASSLFRCLRNVAQLDDDVNQQFSASLLKYKSKILRFLKRYKGDASVQVEGTLLLFFMYFRRPNTDTEKQVLVDVLLKAMDVHNDQKTLQQFATAMLCDLVILGGAIATYINQSMARSLIVKAMKSSLLTYSKDRFWNEVIVQFQAVPAV